MRAHPIEVPDLQHIVVVGASLAGLRAAEALRDAGYDATLTLVGAERRLPYDRPPLSKQVLSGDWDAERTELRDRAHYEALDLDLRLGRTATALDLAARAVELDGDARVSFDALIVATGAAPRVLPATPDLEGIHTLRTLEDCLAIRRAFDDGGRVAVVGAGFIGSEVAATARGRGLDVTLIEASPVPLVRAVGEESERWGRRWAESAPLCMTTMGSTCDWAPPWRASRAPAAWSECGSATARPWTPTSWSSAWGSPPAPAGWSPPA